MSEYFSLATFLEVTVGLLALVALPMTFKASCHTVKEMILRLFHRLSHYEVVSRDIFLFRRMFRTLVNMDTAELKESLKKLHIFNDGSWFLPDLEFMSDMDFTILGRIIEGVCIGQEQISKAAKAVVEQYYGYDQKTDNLKVNSQVNFLVVEMTAPFRDLFNEEMRKIRAETLDHSRIQAGMEAYRRLNSRDKVLPFKTPKVEGESSQQTWLYRDREIL